LAGAESIERGLRGVVAAFQPGADGHGSRIVPKVSLA
jgi:hypothetical protein